eukprot:6722965-Pyramimonas_sp.AAC.1
MVAPRSRGRFGRGCCDDLSWCAGDSSDWGTPQNSALGKFGCNTAKPASNCVVPRKMGQENKDSD